MHRFFLLLSLIGTLLCSAQESAPVTEKNIEQSTLSTLEELLEVISENTSELERRRMILSDAQTNEEREDITAGINELKEKQNALNVQFGELATGVREADISKELETALTLNQEARLLLSPLINEARRATENPREIENLRSEIETLKARQSVAQNAIQNLETLIPEAEGLLKEELMELKNSWQGVIDSSQGELSATRLQLRKREEQKKSFVTSASEFFKTFFKSRGWNLTKAVLAFTIIFILFRRLYPLITRISPIHKKGHRNFLIRATELVYMGATIVLAAIAALVTLYFAGDWVLLSLCMLVLLGLFWGARRTLPPLVEQIRLVLNLGPVREDERIIYNGIPWKVSHLAFFSKLTNPELAGGLVRLPARTLLNYHSRPYDSDEIWFPTSKGDWVILSDDTYGKISIQTPEYVQIVELGGARKTYPANDFLALAPRNLSNGFRAKVVFGIDYSHQNISTKDVPNIFQEDLTKSLTERFTHEFIKNINVEFESANASSLDYAILCDFTGDAASQFKKIQRAIQSTCVDTCNEQKWGIPFQQITIHQAS